MKFVPRLKLIRSKITLFFLLIFVLFVSYFLINIFRHVSNIQTLVQTTSQASEVIQQTNAGKWCGLPCNYSCDPAFGAVCGLGFECMQTSSGSRCRNPQTPDRADCGANGGLGCGEECDPSGGKNCISELICIDQKTGGSKCINPAFPDDINCKNSSQNECPPGLIRDSGGCRQPLPTLDECPPGLIRDSGGCRQPLPTPIPTKSCDPQCTLGQQCYDGVCK